MIETHIGDAKKLYYAFKDRVKEYVNEEWNILRQTFIK